MLGNLFFRAPLTAITINLLQDRHVYRGIDLSEDNGRVGRCKLPDRRTPRDCFRVYDHP